MTAVHQLVPSMVPHDATADHTLQVQRALREAGFDSEVYALAVHPHLQDRVRLAHELPGASRPDGHLIYQYSAVSPLADRLLGRRERVALNFHNVTPAHFFDRWAPGIRLALHAAQVQLDQLARLQPLGLCDSEVNAEDLRGHGVARTAVVPVLVDLDRFAAEPDRAAAEALAARWGRGTTWLFVGTVAPHKAQHELVQALAWHRRAYDPEARLVLVGRSICPGYDRALHRYVDELGLGCAVERVERATHGELVALYRSADLFVTMSRHEGFCVPVLEAMACDLPVVARPAGALAGTVGDAGVLVPGGPAAVAAACARVATDAGARRALVAAGRRRVEELSLARGRAAMVSAVRAWVAEPA